MHDVDGIFGPSEDDDDDALADDRLIIANLLAMLKKENIWDDEEEYHSLIAIFRQSTYYDIYETSVDKQKKQFKEFINESKYLIAKQRKISKVIGDIWDNHSFVKDVVDVLELNLDFVGDKYPEMDALLQSFPQKEWGDFDVLHYLAKAKRLRNYFVKTMLGSDFTDIFILDKN